MSLLIYAAGPMTGLVFEEALQWRDTLSKELDPKIVVLSPLRGKDFLSGTVFHCGDYGTINPLSTMKAITNRDRNDVMRSDLVFANLLGAKTVSIGTVLELAWADSKRIPIVLLMESDSTNPHEHCMIREICPFVTDNFNEGIEITRNILLS